MSARRFFIGDRHAIGEEVTIGDADAHKIRDVLRLRPDDEIEVIDSAAVVYRARLVSVDQAVRARLDEIVAAAPHDDAIRIDVAQGIPKGQKMDFVVEKLTELGVSRVLPFTSERTVVRDPGESKVERWRRLAHTAAQQSGRRSIPDILDPVDFDGILAAFAQYDCVLFPWEVAAGNAPLRATLPPLVAGARRILALVGPEGGFSHAEAERARAAGAHVISLGGRILRTETAALVLIAILQYLRE